MDYAVFKQANTLMEVHKLASKLKAEGEDPVKVNEFSMQRRKELVALEMKVAGYSKLKKGFCDIKQPRKKTTLFAIEVENMHGNCMTIMSGNAVKIS